MTRDTSSIPLEAPRILPLHTRPTVHTFLNILPSFHLMFVFNITATSSQTAHAAEQQGLSLRNPHRKTSRRIQSPWRKRYLHSRQPGVERRLSRMIYFILVTDFHYS